MYIYEGSSYTAELTKTFKRNLKKKYVPQIELRGRECVPANESRTIIRDIQGCSRKAIKFSETLVEEDTAK